jgi:hypothetical protein
MSLIERARNISTDAQADALVEAIFQQQVPAGQNQVEKLRGYFDDNLRKAVFAGGTTTSHYVTLSDAATRLGDAFLRRYKLNGQFQPVLAYHKTSRAEIANLIVAGGFRYAESTTYGFGAYFFLTPEKAQSYVPQGRVDEKFDVTLMVTLYARHEERAHDMFPAYGGDRWVLRPVDNVLVVKNPLIILPRAVVGNAHAFGAVK